MYAKRYDLPLGYHAEADKESWEKLKMFLIEIFKTAPEAG